MNNVCNIPLVFIYVHNAILCFLSYHVPMFSLLMYFVRNDKNKDDQSKRYCKFWLCYINTHSYIILNAIWCYLCSKKYPINLT